MPPQKQNRISQIVHLIFKYSDGAYDLTEFEGMDFDRVLEITSGENNRFSIVDPKSRKKRVVYDAASQKSNPAEIVRQLWVAKLTSHYGYPLDRIDTEKSITLPGQIKPKTVDLVVYKNDKTTPYILFAIKNAKPSKGIDQIKKNLTAKDADITVWSGGAGRVILYRPYGKEVMGALPDLPHADQTVDDVLESKKTYLEYTVPNLRLTDAVTAIFELTAPEARAQTAGEVLKLIFAKLYDESEAAFTRPDHEILLRTWRDPAKTHSAVTGLFNQAVAKWPGVFGQDEPMALSAQQLSVMVALLERIRLYESDTGRAQEALEYLISADPGQKKPSCSTPRHVIDAAIAMLAPAERESVMDPRAGYGAFLIAVMQYVRDRFLHASPEAMDEYAKEHIWGIEPSPEISRASRLLMLIAGDGRSHIMTVSGLDQRQWEKATGDAPKSFEIIMTNACTPNRIQDPSIISQYALGSKNTKPVKKIEEYILILERSIALMGGAGRMCIILPQEMMHSPALEYVRDHLLAAVRILAIIDFHPDTFGPGMRIPRTLLILQKTAGASVHDYRIFMAISKKPGQDASGTPVYKKDDAGNDIYDSRGRKIIDHDLDEIADAFAKFWEEEQKGISAPLP